MTQDKDLHHFLGTGVLKWSGTGNIEALEYFCGIGPLKMAPEHKNIWVSLKKKKKKGAHC